MSGVRTVYVEFGRDRAPMTWQDGRLLAEDETSAREEVQREFGRIVMAARTDRRSGEVRAVRAGDLLLVETRVSDHRPRIDATVVIDRPVRVRWASAAAQVIGALHEGGVTADRRRVRTSLVDAWHRTGSVPERLAAPFARLAAWWRGGDRDGA
ncbi:hypothetical protein [Actinoplanes aureus]|uniref:Uncharacterized protein n=1 Tax=Actinoplanes aureus TaxID=2792083 RepID=A0A931C8P1_9ACTN|nr:hypothetical protein [Actinoplanes aureus]MBG0565494.1 hypothetical protein [Actinoplanes aureus]